MPRHSKRRQSRTGRLKQKPTDQRREVAGEPGFTTESANRILGQRGVKLISTDRQKAGLRYNVIIRGVPRTLKVHAEAL